MGDYHDLYLKTNVVLLVDVFQELSKTCLENYKLDPFHYYTAAGLSFDALFKDTKEKLELFTDIYMHLMIKKGIREGMSMVSRRHAKANNPYLNNYGQERGNNYLMYYDANNLYGVAMSKPLPCSAFRWVKKGGKRKTNKGYINEVDLEYPKEPNDYIMIIPLLRKGLL